MLMTSWFLAYLLRGMLTMEFQSEQSPQLQKNFESTLFLNFLSLYSLFPSSSSQHRQDSAPRITGLCSPGIVKALGITVLSYLGMLHTGKFPRSGYTLFFQVSSLVENTLIFRRKSVSLSMSCIWSVVQFLIILSLPFGGQIRRK